MKRKISILLVLLSIFACFAFVGCDKEDDPVLGYWRCYSQSGGQISWIHFEEKRVLPAGVRYKDWGTDDIDEKIDGWQTWKYENGTYCISTPHGKFYFSMNEDKTELTRLNTEDELHVTYIRDSTT